MPEEMNAPTTGQPAKASTASAKQEPSRASTPAAEELMTPYRAGMTRPIEAAFFILLLLSVIVMFFAILLGSGLSS